MPTIRVFELFLVSLAALALRPGDARAAQLDQMNLRPIGDRFVLLNASAEQLVWQQEISCGVAGVLTGVDVYPRLAGPSFRFFVNRGAGWQSDGHDFEALVASTVENLLPVGFPDTINPFHIDVSSAGIVLAAGETFVIGFQGVGEGEGLDMHAMVLSSTPGPLMEAEPGYYAPGRLLLDDVANNSPPALQVGMDLAFRTHMQPVPEPASLTLCLGMVCARRMARFGRRSAAG